MCFSNMQIEESWRPGQWENLVHVTFELFVISLQIDVNPPHIVCSVVEIGKGSDPGSTIPTRIPNHSTRERGER